MFPLDGRPAAVIVTVEPTVTDPPFGLNVGVAQALDWLASGGGTFTSGGGVLESGGGMPSSPPSSGETTPVSIPPPSLGLPLLLLPQPVVVPTSASVAASDRAAT